MQEKQENPRCSMDEKIIFVFIFNLFFPFPHLVSTCTGPVKAHYYYDEPKFWKENDFQSLIQQTPFYAVTKKYIYIYI